MSKPNTPTYKTLNWPADNDAPKRRGSLTIYWPAGEGEGEWNARKCHYSVSERGADAVIPPRKNTKPWKAIMAGAGARNAAQPARNTSAAGSGDDEAAITAGTVQKRKCTG